MSIGYLVLYWVTALRLSYLLGESMHFYNVYIDQHQQCQAWRDGTIDNAAFAAQCRHYEGRVTALHRTLIYAMSRCIDIHNDILPYMLIAVLTSVAMPYLYNHWIVPFTERRRIAVDNYKYHTYVAGHIKKREGLNVEL